MKKTITILATKLEVLQEKNDGTLEGGFASIKGGFNTTLGFSNDFICTNSNDCTHSTNNSFCSNTGKCIL